MANNRTTLGNINTERIQPVGVPQPNSLTGIQPNGAGGSSLLICPYQCKIINLAVAFGPTQVIFQGSCLMAVYSTGSTAVLMVSFEQPGNDLIPFYAPLSIRGFPFTCIWISNPVAQAGQTITLFASMDRNTTTLETEMG
jgi:hypothetical protein